MVIRVLGVLYLLICMTTGYVLCTYLLPDLEKLTDTTFRGKTIRLNRGFVLLPAWFFSGTLLVTWTNYLLAFSFQKSAAPLGIANAITMSVYAAVSVSGILLQAVKKKEWCMRQQLSRLTAGEVVFLAAVVYLVCRLMWRTFFVEGETLYVGLSVFSDFAPHLGMIRSFSLGNNFPTVYSHYTGEDIRYHFMFQFLVGNLEFLGMRLDWAFNLPSALSLVSVFSLLYVLAVRLSGIREVGYLSALFFAFRCSPSFFFLSGRSTEGYFREGSIKDEYRIHRLYYS